MGAVVHQGLGLVLAIIWRTAWSDPSDPAQSICKLEKVALLMAMVLNQARSKTLSHSLLEPWQVTIPGVLARVRRLLTTHSSSFQAQWEGSIMSGDHDLEWVLKLPRTSIGVKGSRSSAGSTSRLDLSLTSW